MRLEEMKEAIKQYAKNQKGLFIEVGKPWDTVTLYHGTTTRHLNSILQHGLTPRMINQISNFEDVPSNDELVYLTTRWHYWYAHNANQQSLISQVGLERFEEEDIEGLWRETQDIPMYIECEVPRELLTLDEDVVYQYNIRKAIKKGSIQKPEDITVDMCLEQGTVASLLPISLEYINEIVILGNVEYRDYLLEGSYGSDASNWFKGFGLGHTDMWEMIMLESSHFKKGNHIIEVNAEKNELIKSLEITDEGLKLITE